MTSDGVVTAFDMDHTGTEEPVTDLVNYDGPGHCYTPRWCEEAVNHDGPHRKYLLHHKTDIYGMNIDTGKGALVGLVRQGESSRVSGIVLILDDKQVALPWNLARRMAKAILTEADTVTDGDGILENT